MPMYKKSMLILLLLVSVAAAGTLYGYSTSDEAVNIEAKGRETAVQVSEGEKSLADEEIVVYVCGEVTAPGLVTLKAGSRAAEAINQCGGFLPTADSSAVNMAQLLKDGMEIRIPPKNAQQNANGNNSTKAETGAGGAASQANGLVNINQADEKGLEALPGIGPAMAQRIIEFRTANGSFQSVEDLQKVKGIGKAKFAKLKDKVCV